jgi:WD40 repeat protein
MIYLENENILKLILKSSTKPERKYLSDKIKNKLLNSLLLKLFQYQDLYKSLGKKQTILKGHQNRVCTLALLPNGDLISGSSDETLKIWSIKTFKCIRTLIGHEDPVLSIAITKDFKIISCSESQIKIWNIKNNYACINTVHLEDTVFYKILLLPNNEIACSASVDKRYLIIIFDLHNQFSKVKTLYEHRDLISCFVNLNNAFTSASYDKTVIIWDINNHYNCVKILTGHRMGVQSLLFIERKQLLLSGSLDNSIKVWALDNYIRIKTIECNEVECLLLLPTGYIASCSCDRKIKITNLENYKCINKFIGHTMAITSILLLPDKGIVSASADKLINIWKY